MKGKNLIIAVLLIAVIISFAVLNTVKAVGTENEEGTSVVKVEDSAGTKYYADLNDALNTAQSGAKVTLLKDLKDYEVKNISTETEDSGTKRVAIGGGKQITFNFNGHTISSDSSLATGKATFVVRDGATVTFEGAGGITNNSNGGALLVTGSSSEVTLNGGTYLTTGSGTQYATVAVTSGSKIEVNSGATLKNTNANTALALQGNTTIGNIKGGTITLTGTRSDNDNYAAVECNESTLDVYEGTTITAVEDGSGIYASGTNPKVTINGGKITAKGFAVAGNGRDTTNSTIIIKDGELTSTDTAAIYHPEKGNLTIEGGTIKGYFGIVSRQGTVKVEGGDIIATGTDPKIVGSNGTTLNVGAIVTDNDTGSYPDTTTVEVTGGDFTGDIIGYDDDENDDISLTGGSFDKEVPKKYIEESLLEVKNGSKYYLGKNAENALTEAKSGDKLTVLNGDVELTGIHNGVEVTNEGEGEVTLNGQKVERTPISVTNQMEQDLENLRKRLEALEKELNDKEIESEKAKEELNALKEKIDSLEAENQELKDKVNNLEKENQELKDKVNNLEKENEKLKDKVEKLEIRVEKLEAKEKTTTQQKQETTQTTGKSENSNSRELDDEPKTGDTYVASAGLVTLLSLAGTVVSKRFIK